MIVMLQSHGFVLVSSLRKYFITGLVLKDELVLFCKPSTLPLSLSFLKHHSLSRYKICVDATAVDLLNSYELIYFLLSVTYERRLKLKTIIEPNGTTPSCSLIYKSLGWSEREIWDMFGVFFLNHTDLRRILTDYGFVGHPLRKSFPISGYLEARYDSTKKRIVLEQVELSQEFRGADFASPWLST
jgi:NADH:ubiquinone oxidoreductase subunit C